MRQTVQLRCVSGPNRPGSPVLVVALFLAAIVIGGCGRPQTGSGGDGGDGRLFDGETLGQWKVTDFGGQGKVRIEDGAIVMEMGQDMTGITWTGPVVRMNYEITCEAMRVDGTDFFCGLTFPVNDKPCTLVLGGWGGSVCGLSNIDYYDAANNETTHMMSFENKRWYAVRLRVTSNRIEAWVDGKPIVNTVLENRHIDIRSEVYLCQPLGFATWQTAGAVRNIRMVGVPDEPVQPAPDSFYM